MLHFFSKTSGILSQKKQDLQEKLKLTELKSSELSSQIEQAKVLKYWLVDM